MANLSSPPHDSFVQMYITSADLECFSAKPGILIFTTFNMTNIFLFLPLCFFILHSGVQQWWQSNRSTLSMSFSDCFTYHLAIIELIDVFGCVLNLCGIYTHQKNILVTGLCLSSFASFGGNFFHVLTCVDRYLAVLHPLTYMILRKNRGLRIILISVGCVWLFCIVETGLMRIGVVFIILNFCVLIPSLVTVCYCTISVLCALIGPGPGKQCRSEKKVDQMKQRAFYTILAILGPLTMRFAWAMAWAMLSLSPKSFNCVVLTVDAWLNLPSSLVLPVLFLHKAGKFVSLKTKLYMLKMHA